MGVVKQHITQSAANDNAKSTIKIKSPICSEVSQLIMLRATGPKQRNLKVHQTTNERIGPKESNGIDIWKYYHGYTLKKSPFKIRLG